MQILLTLIIFCLIVVIHEFGHFIAARRSGVEVIEFAVGMGPKIWSYKGKETTYSIRLLPLGGFCNMKEGESDSSFNNASVPKRIIIISAGAIMNFVLAFIIFTSITLVDQNSYGIVQTLRVDSVSEGMNAEKAGLMPDDVVKKINGKHIHIADDLNFYMYDSTGETIELTVKRNGKNITMPITPTKTENGYKIGFITEYKAPIFGSNPNDLEKLSIFETLYMGFWQMIFVIKITIVGLMRLITRQIPASELSGPIGVATVIGETYNETIKIGILQTVTTLAYIGGLISANLGVMNLLPFPALDGGRLVFLVLELFRGKPVPAEKEGFVHFLGFAALMLLAVFIAFSDIYKLI